MNIKNMEKIKEYENFILFKNKNTGIRECFLKTDIYGTQNKTTKHTTK